MGVSHRWVPVKTHSTPVPSKDGRLWVAHKGLNNEPTKQHGSGVKQSAKIQKRAPNRAAWPQSLFWTRPASMISAGGAILPMKLPNLGPLQRRTVSLTNSRLWFCHFPRLPLAVSRQFRPQILSRASLKTTHPILPRVPPGLIRTASPCALHDLPPLRATPLHYCHFIAHAQPSLSWRRLQRSSLLLQFLL